MSSSAIGNFLFPTYEVVIYELVALFSVKNNSEPLFMNLDA